MRPRARRWIRRALLGFLALLVAVVGALLVVVHTDWGREQLRRRALAVLAEKFPGGVEIAGLDGSVLGDIDVRGVVLRDAAGRPAVTVEHLRVNLGLLSLFGGELELETLDASGVTVLAVLEPGQPANLATMMAPSDEPSTWDVALPHVRVRDLDVTIDRAGQLEHLDDLSIDAAANLPADGPLDVELALAGVARERAGAMLAVSGTVWSSEAGVVVPDFHAALGRAAIDVHAFTYRASGVERPGAVSGGLALLVPAGELMALVPGAGVSAELDARVAVDLRMAAGQRGLDALDGDVSITGRGGAGGVTLDRLDGLGRVIDGVAYLDAWARGPGKTELVATGQVTMDGEAIVVRQAHVEGSVASLAAAVPGRGPLDGSATFAIDASARLAVETTLSVRATARARRVVAGELRAAEASVEVVATGQPRALALEVEVAGKGLRNGREVLPDLDATLRGGVSGPIAIDLDARSPTWKALGAIGAQVTLGPPDQDRLIATIDVRGYRFDLPRTRIEGKGGRIVLERDRVIIDGLRMRGAGARLAVDGTAGLGPKAGQLDLRVALTALRLDRLRGVPGLPRDLAGTVAVTANVHRRGVVIGGEVEASATGLVLAGRSGPVDLTLGADVKPGRINVGLSARGRALGSLAAILDVVPPRRLDDVRAWTRLDRSALLAVDVRAERLDLARLSELAGQAPSVEGVVDGTIGLDRTRAGVELRGRGLVMVGAPAPVDLELAIDLSEADLAKVNARASVRDLGDLALATAVDLPARPFDPAAWRAIDERAVHAIDLTVAQVDIDEARARRLGLGALRGKVAAEVHVEPGLREGVIRVAGRELVVAPLLAPVAFTLESTIGPRATTSELSVALGDTTVATGTVAVPIGVAQLRAGVAIDPRALPVEGTLTIPPTPVAAFTRALDRAPRPVEGTVHGTATVAGTAATPTATLALVVDELRARAGRGPAGRRRAAGIRQLTVDARYQDGAVHGEVRGHAHDGGELAVVADLDPAAPADARATVTATRFQVGPLARLAPAALLGVRGVVDADLQVRGIDPATARVAGTVRVSGGQAPISDAVGNLREAELALTVRGADLRATMKGKLEGGSIEASATATLVGLLPDRGTIDVTVAGVELISETAPQLDGKLSVELVRDDDRWRAVARVHGARVIVPDDEGRVLHPAELPPDLFFTSDLGPGQELPRTRASALEQWLGVRPTRPFLEVAIHIEPVTVVSEQLRGEVRGQLQVAVGTDGVSIDGRIGVSTGKVLLFDRRYGIERADLAFDGGIDPLLDIQLEYEFPQVAMHVGLEGRLSKPTLRLTADPPTYSEGELLTFLLGGTPGAPGAVSAPPSVTGVATAAATQLVGGLVSQRLPVRLDVINYEAVTSQSSSAFVIGRWIRSTILVLLRTRIDARPDENSNEAEVELWLTPRLVLEGVAGDRGVLGADLLWNRRW